MDKSRITKILSVVAGTSPGIFSLRAERLSRIPKTHCQEENSPSIALLRSLPCASIRFVRRPDQGLFVRPSAPPPRDLGAAAAFSSLSFNLPGPGLRLNPSGRSSPMEVFYEELSHQGHPKRWHCRPRRHRQDATGVVVALHRGHDPALGKNCGRQHHHRLGRRRNLPENLHSNGTGSCRVVRHSHWTFRSEEHTSELNPQINSYSRLFFKKKKNKSRRHNETHQLG